MAHSVKSLVAALVVAALGVSATESGHYVATTVQTVTVLGFTPKETMMKTAKSYRKYTHEAKSSQGTQIIVFPELGLGANHIDRAINADYGEVYPDPKKERITPCDASKSYQESHPALTYMSCLAKELKVHIVFGCVDKQPCTKASNPDCPADNMFLYNTGIALNDEGVVVAKYWKEHIFFTLGGVFNIPKVTQEVSFKSSFGVTFGLFICFDIVWEKPAIPLLMKGIRDFTFPTSYNNFPPAMTALQIQQGFSAAHNATLIASNNAGDLNQGGAISGSGIYLNGDPLQFFFDDSGRPTVKSMTARLPIRKAPSPTKAVATQKATPKPVVTLPHREAAPPSSNYTDWCGMVNSRCQYFTPSAGKAFELKANDGDVHCAASIVTANDDTERFALVAINAAVKLFQNWALRVKTCSVLKCYSDKICVILDPLWNKPERSLFSSNAAFTKLELHGSGFSTTNHSAVLPFISTDKGQILRASEFEWAKNGAMAHMSLKNDTAKMIDFTLFEHVF